MVQNLSGDRSTICNFTVTDFLSLLGISTIQITFLVHPPSAVKEFADLVVCLSLFLTSIMVYLNLANLDSHLQEFFKNLVG